MRLKTRSVRSATSGTPAEPARQADIDSQIEGVRSSGHEVESTLVGVPQPMPPAEIAHVVDKAVDMFLSYYRRK